MESDEFELRRENEFDIDDISGSIILLLVYKLLKCAISSLVKESIYEEGMISICVKRQSTFNVFIPTMPYKDDDCIS